ncbi:MAG: hypothetical protein WEC75_10545 [Dehalococcoidia bacterium]
MSGDTISVQTEEHRDGWTAQIIITEGGTSTRHRVTLARADYDRLTGGTCTPDDLVYTSAVFLLERESKESILRSFDLMTIARYFPEYEREIVRRLEAPSKPG